MMNKHLDKIDNDIAEKHLLKHPFYLAWTRGELSKEALTDYAKQYYHHVAAFPTYLSAVHARCDDQPTLSKQFAAGLGVEDVDLEKTEKQPETKNLIETFRSACGEQSTAEGLA